MDPLERYRSQVAQSLNCSSNSMSISNLRYQLSSLSLFLSIPLNLAFSPSLSPSHFPSLCIYTHQIYTSISLPPKIADKGGNAHLLAAAFIHAIPSGMTSCPIPSPGMTAILNFFLLDRSFALAIPESDIGVDLLSKGMRGKGKEK